MRGGQLHLHLVTGMDTSSIGDVRSRPPGAGPRLLPGLAAAALATLFWGLLLRSPWVAVTTLALAAIPVLTLRFARLPAPAWAGIAFLTGGTVSAIALLTHHAALP
jgi:hypothetical protein